MITDEESIKGSMLDIEAKINTMGWKRAATLHMIYREGDTTLFLPYPDQPEELHPSPPIGIHVAAVIFSRLSKKAPPPKGLWVGLVGLAFAAEGYMESEPGATKGDPRDLADIPGSKEVRTVVAMDTSARVYNIVRVRGEKPEFWLMRPGESLAPSGVVPAGLWMLMDEMADVAPDGTFDRAQLELVGRTITRAMFSA